MISKSWPLSSNRNSNYKKLKIIMKMNNFRYDFINQLKFDLKKLTSFLHGWFVEWEGQGDNGSNLKRSFVENMEPTTLNIFIKYICRGKYYMMTRHVAPDQCAKLKVSCKEDILRKTKHVVIWKKSLKNDSPRGWWVWHLVRPPTQAGKRELIRQG